MDLVEVALDPSKSRRDQARYRQRRLGSSKATYQEIHLGSRRIQSQGGLRYRARLLLVVED